MSIRRDPKKHSSGLMAVVFASVVIASVCLVGCRQAASPSADSPPAASRPAGGGHSADANQQQLHNAMLEQQQERSILNARAKNLRARREKSP